MPDKMSPKTGMLNAPATSTRSTSSASVRVSRLHRQPRCKYPCTNPQQTKLNQNKWETKLCSRHATYISNRHTLALTSKSRSMCTRNASAIGTPRGLQPYSLSMYSKPSSAASLRACSPQLLVLAANVRKVRARLSGGPFKRNSIGGARVSKMSSRSVARESITYKCSQKSSSRVGFWPPRRRPCDERSRYAPRKT